MTWSRGNSIIIATKKRSESLQLQLGLGGVGVLENVDTESWFANPKSDSLNSHAISSCRSLVFRAFQHLSSSWPDIVVRVEIMERSWNSRRTSLGKDTIQSRRQFRRPYITSFRYSLTKMYAKVCENFGPTGIFFSSERLNILRLKLFINNTGSTTIHLLLNLCVLDDLQ